METKQGNFLPNKFKATKTQIPYLYHPMNKTKVLDPQAIAETFNRYYSTL